MKLQPHIILILALACAVFALSIWYEAYRYDDCRKVQHSKFYCIMNIGD